MDIINLMSLEDFTSSTRVLSRDDGMECYVVKGDVSAFFRTSGSEIYSVIGGTGELRYGEVTRVGDHYLTAWQEVLHIRAGDLFHIKTGEANEIVGTPGNPLTLLVVASPDVSDSCRQRISAYRNSETLVTEHS